MSVRLVLTNNNNACRSRLGYVTEVLLGKGQTDTTVEVLKDAQPGLYFQDKFLLPQSKLEFIFQRISLRAEIESGKYDKLGRLDPKATRSESEKPWIDENSVLLRSRLKDEGVMVDGPSQVFKVIFTHDVDMVTGFEPQCIMRSLLKRHFLQRKKTWLSLRQCFMPRELLRNLERLLEIERKNSIRAWYHIAAGRYGLYRHSSFYNANWLIARSFIQKIKDAGGHVGLHGSFGAREKDSYKDEANRLRQVSGMQIIAHRNHYLRFDPVRLWGQLERAGIHIDSSIGFGKKTGFRAGTSRPYHPYDLLNEQKSTVTEIPLVFMDAVNHLSNLDVAFSNLKNVINSAQRMNGCIALLFHPENMAMDERWYIFYQRVIEHCQSIKADISGEMPVGVN
jgi:hypothetical protein